MVAFHLVTVLIIRRMGPSKWQSKFGNGKETVGCGLCCMLGKAMHHHLHCFPVVWGRPPRPRLAIFIGTRKPALLRSLGCIEHSPDKYYGMGIVK